MFFFSNPKNFWRKRNQIGKFFQTAKRRSWKPLKFERFGMVWCPFLGGGNWTFLRDKSCITIVAGDFIGWFLKHLPETQRWYRGRFRLLKLWFPSTSSSWGIICILESAPRKYQKSHSAHFSHGFIYQTIWGNQIKVSSNISGYHSVTSVVLPGSLKLSPWKYDFHPKIKLGGVVSN